MSDHKPKYPSGIPFIIGNEAAERFSYYGMKAILVIFMTKYLMDSSGQVSPMSEAEARTWYHTFSMANYFFPILGAVLADVFWGKYKTIISLSLVYCLGHLCLSLDDTRLGLSLGLTLIAIGSGGIKPCVSANVGDQFTEANKSLIDKVFSVFYFSINFGSFFSTLLTPLLLEIYGPSVAFAIPGILMFVATIIFWMGRHKFVPIAPVGWKKYKEDFMSPQGKKALMTLPVIYLFIAMFWALYDQTGSSWVLQAEHLNRNVDLSFGIFEFMKFEILASQVQAINPILVMLFIPIFSYGIYPWAGKFCKVNSLWKISVGFFITTIAFGLVAYTEQLIVDGQTPSILWQLVAFFIITAAEVMVSITGLEFSYTQAPNSMKSFIMGLFLLSVSLGNFLTAWINYFIQNPDGTTSLSGPDYYWFFTWMMLGTSLLFLVIKKFYKEESYVQGS